MNVLVDRLLIDLYLGELTYCDLFDVRLESATIQILHLLILTQFLDF